jgi:hypothetical protein
MMRKVLIGASQVLSALAADHGFIKAEKKTATLVLLDSWAIIETHSHMFDYLRDTLGHQVTFEMMESKINLKDSAQQWRFDNIVLMTPSVKGRRFVSFNLLLENAIDASVRVENLVEFFEAPEHNLVAFGDVDARRHFRNLGLNFGIDFQPFVSR